MGGAQAHRGARGGRLRRSAFLARRQAAQRARPSPHRQARGVRHARGHSLRRDGVARGRGPRGATAPRPARPATTRSRWPAGRGGARRRARAGVIHRDIKPSNIFLMRARGSTASEPFAKLVDFGVAARRRRAAHADRRGRRHAGVHGARAGARRGRARCARRHLLARRDALRADRRPPAARRARPRSPRSRAS